MGYEVRTLQVGEIAQLKALFRYKNVKEMIKENTKEITKGEIDIFVLLENGKLIGELRAKYVSEDKRFAVKGKRAYLYAYRIHKKYQGRGLGKLLLETVLDVLRLNGYSEFTIGVEDDNVRAKHIYENQGFIEPIDKIVESYQGDNYEYMLFLKRI